MINSYTDLFTVSKINKLCAYDIRANHTEKPFFDDEFVNNTAIQQFTNEACVLMARNFNIVEELRDHDSCLPFNKLEQANTTGDFIGIQFRELPE